jgi:hypothetical protein
MTSQATKRREGGSASCPGRSQQLWTYTSKELETAWAAPELLGAPTIGGGSARPWVGGGEVIYAFTAIRNSQKRRKNRQFRARFGL